MKGEHISDALGGLSESIIQETIEVRENRVQTYNINWYRWGAVAAAAILIISVSVAGVVRSTINNSKGPSDGMHSAEATIKPTENAEVTEPVQPTEDIMPTEPVIDEKPTPNPELNLPMITIVNEFIVSGGMGDGGIAETDITYLDVDSHPWNKETVLETLPVYRNLAFLDDQIDNTEEEDEKITENILKIAKKLDIDVESSDVVKEDNGFADCMWVAKDGVRLTADLSGVEVSYDDGLIIPDEYNTDNSIATEDLEKVYNYLIEEYKEILDMEKPEMKFVEDNYKRYEEGESYYIEIYDASGDVVSQIVNNSYKTVRFEMNRNKLLTINVNMSDLSDKTGDYPVATLDKATELLLKGNYLTEEYTDIEPEENAIKKVEIGYGEVHQKYSMPYYCFYIDAPVTECGYEKFYVPAVEEAYIINMPYKDVIIH